MIQQQFGPLLVVTIAVLLNGCGHPQIAATDQVASIGTAAQQPAKRLVETGGVRPALSAPASSAADAMRPVRPRTLQIPPPSASAPVVPANLRDFVASDLPVVDRQERSFPYQGKSCQAVRRAAYMTGELIVFEIAFVAAKARGNCNLAYWLARSTLESPTNSHKLLAVVGPEGLIEDGYLKSTKVFALFARNGLLASDLDKVLFNAGGNRDSDSVKTSERLFGGPPSGQLSAMFKTQDAHREALVLARLSTPQSRRLMDDCNVQAFEDHFQTHDAYLGFLGSMTEGERRTGRTPFAESLANYYADMFRQNQLRLSQVSVASTDNFSRTGAEDQAHKLAGKEAAALKQAIASRARKPSAWSGKDITCTYAIVWKPSLFRADAKRMWIPNIVRGRPVNVAPARANRAGYLNSLIAIEPQFRNPALAAASLPNVVFNFPDCPSQLFNSRRALEPVPTELGAKLWDVARATPGNELLLTVSFRFTHVRGGMWTGAHAYVVDPDVAVSRARIHTLSGELLHDFGSNARMTCQHIPDFGQ